MQALARLVYGPVRTGIAAKANKPNRQKTTPQAKRLGLDEDFFSGSLIQSNQHRPANSVEERALEFTLQRVRNNLKVELQLYLLRLDMPKW